ncbi:type IVB secretion system protein IcmH/DotU [Marinobacter sp. C2H3]|uniref:type IVB secretion system protein IcmH/DotU n=1 Tax=Marinobacter sp. C2H3 TaxID=3119003 RepID=UPI00300F2239
MTQDTAMDAPIRSNDNALSGTGPSFADQLFAGREQPDAPATGDPQFQLRGREPNRLVDAAIPLLGLVIRVRRLADYRGVERLYQQVVEDITAIDRELIEQGYERPTVVAYRYVLCAFIDEAVLGTDWGAHSVWSQQSLLSRFHNETWGGEKVFAILARMEQEPERFRDMLSFLYLCLSLGFEGRYKVMENGREEYDRIRQGLYDTLRATRPADASGRSGLGDAFSHVTPARPRRRSGLPLWGVAGLFTLAMAGVYGLYSLALNERITDVLRVLDQLPK